MLRRPLFCLLLVGLTALTGCSGCSRDEEIDGRYGRMAGTAGRNSVNGTAVLADMFDQRGHTVISRSSLTPTVAETANIIVWAPGDHTPPDAEVVEWIDDWLWDQPNRKFIFIGRDYDAAITYWDKVIPNAPPAQANEMRRRRNEAVRETNRTRSGGTADCDWFEVLPGTTQKKATEFEGTWGADFDPAKAEIEWRDRLEPNALYVDEELLSSQGDMLIGRYRETHWSNGSEAILIVNGSFLLNLPLVNHEHRRIAGRIIDDTTGSYSGDATVFFIESGPGGPSVLDTEPENTIPTGLEQFAIWPQNIVLLHLAAAGIIFCFARWPIFGRPKPPEKPPTSDFGQHVIALGDLLENTRDRNYAMTRHLQYQQGQHNESSFGATRESSAASQRPPLDQTGPPRDNQT